MGNSTGRQLNSGHFGAALMKILLVILLALFLVFVYARSYARDVDLSVVDEKFQADTAIGTMNACSARELLQFLNIDAANYQDFLYYKSGEALGVDEVLVLKATDRELLNAAQDAVESRIGNQIHDFEGYGPRQVRMLRNAIVLQKGSYLFYCVAPDPESYEEVFRHAV